MSAMLEHVNRAGIFVVYKESEKDKATKKVKN